MEKNGFFSFLLYHTLRKHNEENHKTKKLKLQFQIKKYLLDVTGLQSLKKKKNHMHKEPRENRY